MSEILTSSNIFLILQLVSIVITIKLIVFPLLKNLTIETHTRSIEPTIPFSEIFLEYDHINPEDWYNWIRKQDSETQAKAFDNLVRYLNISPELFKLVLNDVIRIITAFKRPGAETAIYEFLHKISISDPPKEFYDYYAQALKALIELNPQRAADFLEDEYKRHRKNPEYVKRFVYVSSYFPSDKLPLKFLCHYLLNVEYILEERFKLLNTFKNVPESFYQMAIAILEKLLENKDVDEVITESCFISLLELKDINQKDFLKSLKVLFNKTWVSDHLFAILKNYLIQNADSKINPITLASVISSINPINYDSLKQVLCERYKLSEQEIQLIDSADTINDFLLQSKLELERPINIFDSLQHKLPDFLEEKYIDFKNYCFNDKYNSFKLIYGNNESEKYLLVKKLANEEKKKILVLDIKQLAIDQTLLDNLETHLKVIQNKIVYIPNFEILIKEISSNQDPNSIYRKILNRFKFMALKSNIPILASCNKNSLGAKTDELLADEKEIPKQEYELFNFNQEEQNNSINEYLNQILPERITEKNTPADLYFATKDLSSLNFLGFILNYLKISLLSQGKLFKIDDYQRILDSKEDSISIKDLVAKVKIKD